MKYLILLLSLVFISCYQDFPKSRSVIKGQILNELGLPVQNVSVELEGSDIIGISGLRHTFNNQSFSDTNGVFIFTQVVPKKTDMIYLRVWKYFTSPDHSSYTEFDVQQIKINDKPIFENGAADNMIELRANLFVDTVFVNVEIKVLGSAKDFVN